MIESNSKARMIDSNSKTRQRPPSLLPRSCPTATHRTWSKQPLGPVTQFCVSVMVVFVEEGPMTTDNSASVPQLLHKAPLFNFHFPLHPCHNAEAYPQGIATRWLHPLSGCRLSTAVHTQTFSPQAATPRVPSVAANRMPSFRR